MERITCPDCKSTAMRMPVLSYLSSSDDYFLCENCRQVSQVSKGAARAVPLIVNTLQARSA